MKDEILQIAYSLEKSKIDEGTAKQELCVLLGAIDCLSNIRELLCKLNTDLYMGEDIHNGKDGENEKYRNKTEEIIDYIDKFNSL
jgi:hypothetical protein